MRTAARVLIVALVVLLAGGLLVTAVSRVRDAAARMSCTNNLRQIALSVDNYRTFKNHFPQAARPNPTLPPEKRLSWLVEIGPFVEATNLYVRMDWDKGWDAAENRYLALTSVSLYHCPAFPDRPPVSPLVPTHYIGIAGLGEDAAALPLSDPRAGFFGYERKLTVADVEDRTSTLLMAVETTRTQGAWSAGGPPTVRGLDPDDPPYLGRAGQFGGLHRGGSNAVFADGSVRFLADSLDPGVLEALATVRGSATVDPFGAE